MIINFFQQPCGLQFRDDPSPGGKTVHPFVLVSGSVDDAGFVQDVDLVQAMPQADFKVIEIMRRGDFYNACAELAIHIIIGHNGNLPVQKRQKYLLANQVAVPLVFRMHCNSGVTQHGFGACCCHHHKTAGLPGYRIANMPEMPFLILMLNFYIRQCGVAARAPVNQTVVAVNQAILVQFDKNRTHSFR